MGLDILYSENYTTLVWGHELGTTGPPDLVEWQSRSGAKARRMGGGLPPEGSVVLRSGCLGLTILLLLSDVLCRLVFFFFFFKLGSGLGRGTREGPWKGLLPSLGAVMGAPPSQLWGWSRALGQAFNKLLVILTDHRTSPFFV